jgi:ankyrin repeat protein
LPKGASITGAQPDVVDATIKTLIEHGAALELKDDRGKTAADIAHDLGHERAAKLLER